MENETKEYPMIAFYIVAIIFFLLFMIFTSKLDNKCKDNPYCENDINASRY